MSTVHLVDPELLPVLEVRPTLQMTDAMLELVRVGSISFTASLPEPDLPLRQAAAAGRDGTPEVPLFIYIPPGEPRLRPAILHLHGGGMVLGSPAMNKLSNANCALEHDAVIVSVDYRLAPETPFPGPQEDCYAGLAWLFEHAAELGVDVSRVAVMGESAGGGLAAALAQMVRDRGEYQLCGQILVYPMIDHRTGSADDLYCNPSTGEFIWTRQSNQYGWSALQGNYPLNDERIGWFSPARAASFAGLPSAFIAVGALDLFFDENLDYARRLCCAGVGVELHTYPGAMHGFNILPTARVCQQLATNLSAGIARILQT